MKRPLATVIATLASAMSMVVVLVVASSAEALTWGAPVDVAATSGNSAPQIAVASDGSATAVWSHYSGVNNIIQTATRPAGGSWGAPTDLSATGSNAFVPQIAVASDGSATAVWKFYNGVNNIIQAATRPAGGSWGAATDISATLQNADVPQIAVAADGSATAVWNRFDGSNFIIQAATRPAGGSWSAAADLSATGQNASVPQIAVAADGSATAVWIRSNGTHNIVQAASRPAGGSWGAASDLSATGQSAYTPQVAVAADGSATAVWTRWNGTDYIVQAASRPAGGSWGAAADLSATGRSADAPQIAVAPDGSATAVWSRFNSPNEIIQAATRPAGGSWGAATDLSATGQDNYEPQIAVAADGSATAVWWRDGTDAIIQAATRPAGGSWGAAADLSATGQSAEKPQIAVAPSGTAAAVWKVSSSGFIQAAVSAASSAVLTVATAGTGTGSVSSSPAGISCGATCSASFTLSSTVTLTATPASGSTFAGWSGACTGTSTTCSVTIAGATSATATFTVTSATPAASDAAAATTTASTPTTTAAAPTPPSNRFRALSSRIAGTSIITSIRLPSAGRVTQRGVYRRVSSVRRAACTATETVTRATTVTLICRLDVVASRRAVTLTTTFTPTGGTARTTTRTVMVSPPPPLPSVTG